MIHLTRDSSSRSRNTLVKSVYLKRIKKQLTKDPESVIARLKSCLKTLHKASNFRVYVAANLETLPNPVSTWKGLLTGLDTNEPLQPLDSRREKLSEISRNPGNTAYIVPLATIDSSFGLLTTRGPDSWEHPDLPALMVAQAYLDAVEGPLWVAVRGTGLAYGTGFSRSVDVGLLTLRIYRSPDTYKAYLAAKDEVKGYATGKTPFDKFALEGAVSSIIMGFADEQPTMGSAAGLSFVNQVIRGIGKGWNDQMLEKVRQVKEEEIRDVLQRIIMPIFRPETTNLVVTCATIMEEVSDEMWWRLVTTMFPFFPALATGSICYTEAECMTGTVTYPMKAARLQRRRPMSVEPTSRSKSALLLVQWETLNIVKSHPTNNFKPFEDGS